MKLRALLLLTLLALLLSTTAAIAADNTQASPGADRPGLSIVGGYDGSYLYYVERSSPGGSTLDKDYGLMHGGFVQARYDFESAFLRLRGEGAATRSATYDGMLQNGSPYQGNTHETIFKGEFDAGYKMYDQDGVTFAPYLGIGYRDWRRGKNVLPSYMEDYSWWYGAFGLYLNTRHGQWLVGLDAAVFMPFSMKMTTTTAGLYDKATFNIKPLPGVRVELPVAYEFQTETPGTLSLHLTPYYEKWEIGKSPDVVLTRGGVSTGIAVYEPKSTTDIVGLRLGLGYHF